MRDPCPAGRSGARRGMRLTPATVGKWRRRYNPDPQPHPAHASHGAGMRRRPHPRLRPPRNHDPVLDPFSSIKELVSKIDLFVKNYNANAKSFVWTAAADSILATVIYQRCSRDIVIALAIEKDPKLTIKACMKAPTP